MDCTTGVPEGHEILNRVFIGGLARDTSELELENFFSNFGEVADVRIVCDRKTGLNKGYGFVTFSDPDTRDSLVQKGSIEYKARKLRLRKAVKKETGGQFTSSLNSNFIQEEGPVVANQLVLIPANETPSYTSPVYFQAAAPNYIQCQITFLWDIDVKTELCEFPKPWEVFGR